MLRRWAVALTNAIAHASLGKKPDGLMPCFTFLPRLLAAVVEMQHAKKDSCPYFVRPPRVSLQTYRQNKGG